MNRSVSLAALTAAAALTAWAGQVPRPAQPLIVPTPTGEKIQLADYKGKVVLLKFFSLDCPHCQRTAVAITPIYREWRSRGLEVIGVSIDPHARTGIPDFARRFGVSYPVGIGDRLMVTTFADISAVTRFYVPYIFMIDRKGVIRYEHPGGDHAFYQNEAQNLRAELDLLLKEPAPAARKTSSSNAPRKAVPKSE